MRTLSSTLARVGSPPAAPATLVFVALVVGCTHSEPVVTTPPPPPPPPAPVATCDQVAVHTHALLQPRYGDDPDKLGKLTAIVQARCTDDGWVADVRTCVMGTQSIEDGHHCIDGLPPEQREKLMAQIDEASHAPKPQPIAASGAPPHCLEYRATMEAYANCPSIPADARKAMHDAFEQSWKTFEQVPPEARQAMDDACKQAVDAVTQALASTCPTK